MWDSVGSIDHYLSIKHHRVRAYDWSNLRFVAELLNKRKKNADAEVLDPFEIEDGWFEVILPSLQVRATDLVPPAERSRAEHTLDVLGLRHDERLIETRQAWLRMYTHDGLSLDALTRHAPMIAAAVVRESWPRAPRAQAAPATPRRRGPRRP